jgi:hypothetical protein
MMHVSPALATARLAAVQHALPALATASSSVPRRSSLEEGCGACGTARTKAAKDHLMSAELWEQVLLVKPACCHAMLITCPLTAAFPQQLVRVPHPPLHDSPLTFLDLILVLNWSLPHLLPIPLSRKCFEPPSQMLKRDAAPTAPARGAGLMCTATVAPIDVTSPGCVVNPNSTSWSNERSNAAWA